jgi:hypothetical protein
VFIAWVELANHPSDVFAQHLDAQGDLQWTAGGVPVAAYAGYQHTSGINGPVIARDGSGGIFVGFMSGPLSENPTRSRLQHLDAGGAALWGDSGIAVTPLTPSQINPRLLEDGNGGVFVSWSSTSGSDHRVMVQHFDHDGNGLWTYGGVTACSSVIPQDQWMVSDGNGGVILVWVDFRVQRIRPLRTASTRLERPSGRTVPIAPRRRSRAYRIAATVPAAPS